MGSPFPRRPSSHVFLFVGIIKEKTLTKELRKLSVSRRQAFNLTSCSFTQAPHIQSPPLSTQRPHANLPEKQADSGSTSHPWNVSIIFTKPNPHWLSTVARLGCQGGSALLLSPVPPQCRWTRGTEASAALGLPSPLAHRRGVRAWGDFGPTDQLQPTQAAQKGTWKKLVIPVQFFSWHWLPQIVSHQRDFFLVRF